MQRALQHKGGIMSLDNITNVVASAAVTSPLWLKDIGTVAGHIVPIFGAVWLLVQIGHKLHTWYADVAERRNAR